MPRQSTHTIAGYARVLALVAGGIGFMTFETAVPAAARSINGNAFDLEGRVL